MSEITPFNLLYNVFYKTKKFSDYDIKKNWSSFLACRSLMDSEDCVFVANNFNLRPTIPSETVYETLLEVMPKLPKVYFKFHKQKNEDNPFINKIMDYYKCNKSVALRYFKVIDAKTKEEIEYQLGDVNVYFNKKAH